MPLGYPQGRQGLAAFRSTLLMVSRVIFLKQIWHQLSPLIKISHCPPTASKIVTASNIESNSFAWHRSTLLSLFLLFSQSMSCNLPHHQFTPAKLRFAISALQVSPHIDTQFISFFFFIFVISYPVLFMLSSSSMFNSIISSLTVL